LFFKKSDAHLCGVGKFADQVTVIFDAHLPRFTPLFTALAEGSGSRFIRRFFALFY
jgi:hypothetical protein